MEKATRITSKELEHGYYMHMECCMCGNEETFVGTDKKEVMDTIKGTGWKHLDSHEYMLEGHWCGCSYK